MYKLSFQAFVLTRGPQEGKTSSTTREPITEDELVVGDVILINKCTIGVSTVCYIPCVSLYKTKLPTTCFFLSGLINLTYPILS